MRGIQPTSNARGVICGVAVFGLTAALFMLLGVGLLLTLALSVAWAVVAGAGRRGALGARPKRGQAGASCARELARIAGPTRGSPGI